MKLFQTILVTLTMTLANSYKLLKNGVVTGEAWLHYERSGLLNKALAKRIPERHVVAAQRIQNKKRPAASCSHCRIIERETGPEAQTKAGTKANSTKQAKKSIQPIQIIPQLNELIIY